MTSLRGKEIVMETKAQVIGWSKNLQTVDSLRQLFNVHVL